MISPDFKWIVGVVSLILVYTALVVFISEPYTGPQKTCIEQERVYTSSSIVGTDTSRVTYSIILECEVLSEIP